QRVEQKRHDEVVDQDQHRAGREEQHPVDQGEPGSQAEVVREAVQVLRCGAAFPALPGGCGLGETPPGTGVSGACGFDLARFRSFTRSHSRYPAPGTVCTTGGSPSFLRKVLTVTCTSLMSGSASPSHAFTNSAPALTTLP